MPELYSNEEETEWLVILYLHYVVSKNYTSAVARIPDTNLFFLFLHHATSIKLTMILSIGVWNHPQMLAVIELSDNLGRSIVGFSSVIMFSRERTDTSCFNEKDKIQP